MTAQTLKVVKDKLKQGNFTYSDEWFDACIDWMQGEYTQAELTVENVYSEVEGQWKEMNLEVIGAQCLPPKLMQQKSIIVRGKFPLQVNTINDVGDSAYTQIKKIKKLENENTNVEATDTTECSYNWVPKLRRCLYLSMTDGSVTVFGMEVVSIPQLSLDLPPGVKILVQGPVECRRGVFQLEPGHVTVLGGYVEELKETNSVEQELKKRLDRENPPKLSLPPKPTYKRPASPPSSTKPTNITSSGPPPLTQRTGNSSYSKSDSSYLNSWTPPPTTTMQQQPLKKNPVMSLSSKKPKFIPPPSTTNTYSKVQTTTVTHVDEDDPFVDGDDDLFMDIDESTLLLDHNIVTQSTQPKSSWTGTQSFSSTRTMNQSIRTTTTTKPPPPTRTQQNIKPTVIDLVDDDDDDDYLNFVDFSEIDKKCEQEQSKKVVPKAPYQFLKVLKNNLNKFTNEQIFVKACVATLVSKVSVNNGQDWSLMVCLNDGSDFLEATIESELLNCLIGFTVAEMKTMKRSNDPQVKNRITNGITGLSTSLIHMNGIFGIRVQRGNPIIVSFNEIESHHVAAIKQRLQVVT